MEYFYLFSLAGLLLAGLVVLINGLARSSPGLYMLGVAVMTLTVAVAHKGLQWHEEAVTSRCRLFGGEPYVAKFEIICMRQGMAVPLKKRTRGENI